MVKLGNVSSSVAPITNGIPKGSLLGSALFNVCINDIDTEIEILYDDDFGN